MTQELFDPADKAQAYAGLARRNPTMPALVALDIVDEAVQVLSRLGSQAFETFGAILRLIEKDETGAARDLVASLVHHDVILDPVSQPVKAQPRARARKAKRRRGSTSTPARRADSVRAQALHIVASNPTGVTALEVARELSDGDSRKGQAAVSGLALAGWIIPVGRRRQGRGGPSARVFVLNPERRGRYIDWLKSRPDSEFARFAKVEETETVSADG